MRVAVNFLYYGWRVAGDAFRAFIAADGWAIASHIALSILMALFPFLIVLTAIAGLIGSKELGEEAAHETLWGTVAGAWEAGERAADAALKRLARTSEPAMRRR